MPGQRKTFELLGIDPGGMFPAAGRQESGNRLVAKGTLRFCPVKFRLEIDPLNVRRDNDRTSAAVFVPDGKLARFEYLVRDYIEQKQNRGRSRNNQRLIDARARARFWSHGAPLINADANPLLAIMHCIENNRLADCRDRRFVTPQPPDQKIRPGPTGRPQVARDGRAGRGRFGPSPREAEPGRLQIDSAGRARKLASRRA